MEHAVVPAGHLVYAVGDIHGRADLLAQLLDQIKADAAASVGTKKKTIVFVGDYIDRGPGSRRVVDLLRGALPTGFVTFPPAASAKSVRVIPRSF